MNVTDLPALMRAALVLAIAACGPAARKPALDNTAKTSTKPVPCPRAPELAAIVKTWGSDDAVVEVALCIPLRREGRALWWLEGPAANREATGYVSTGNALIDERRAIVWKQREDKDSFGYEYAGDGEAADLDGDGNDEVLYARTTGEGGVSQSELVVVGFAPAPTMTSIILGGMGGEQTCDGSWSLVPHGRGKLIDVTRKGNACDAKEMRQRYDAQGNEIP